MKQHPKPALAGALAYARRRMSFVLTGLAVILASVCLAPAAKAETVNLKTNLLYDATLSVNIGAEARVAPRWSVDVNGDMNFWTLSDGRKWRHWFAQPELRYWLCEATAGHFFGVHLHGGQYNIARTGKGFMFLGTDFRNLREQRYQGWFAGAGIAYGYSWVFSRHWGLEAEIGLGWAYSRYDVFPCSGCGRKIKSNQHHNYVGPTKAAINLVYSF